VQIRPNELTGDDVKLRFSPLWLAACLALLPAVTHAERRVTVSLEGSRASMQRQNRIAKA
jgi:hypothetical protein